MFDGRQIDPVFTGQADSGHLGFGFLQLLFDAFTRFQSTYTLEMAGIAYFYFVIVYP